jgi:hypothetical protein
MRRIILAATVLAATACSAAAETRYDRSIDQAAAAIVAEKIGDIRGGFDFNEMPEFVHPVDWHRAVWRAVDPLPVASIVTASLRQAL